MQAIVTRYHGPTNARGARISATAEAGRIYIPYPHELNATEAHAAAARAFAERWGWAGRWVGGASPDGRGYVFVCVERAWGADFTVPTAGE